MGYVCQMTRTCHLFSVLYLQLKVSPSTLFCFFTCMFTSGHVLPSSHLLFLQVSVSNKMLSYRLHTLKKIYFTVLFSRCFTVSLIHMVHMSSVPHRSSYIFNLLPFQRATELTEYCREECVCVCTRESESKSEKEKKEMVCSLQKAWQQKMTFLKLVSILAGLKCFPRGLGWSEAKSLHFWADVCLDGRWEKWEQFCRTPTSLCDSALSSSINMHWMIDHGAHGTVCCSKG